MPTNEERREVAARLREHARTVRCVSQACVLNYCIGEDECGNYGVEGCEGCFIKSLNRLADLIEPEPERTCHMTKYGPEYVLAGWWACSECGPVYPPCNEEIAAWALQKCPRCGAKVVEE